LRLHAKGHLCPVCLRTAQQGVCERHGQWKRHQLLTGSDRSRASRAQWQPFQPIAQACPRCLGSVAESRSGFSCVDHDHAHDQHGPFRVDELLAPTAQRESAAVRHRLARHSQIRRREPISFSLQLPDPVRSMRVVASACVIAATLAFLVK
jgi:hypothetical protein